MSDGKYARYLLPGIVFQAALTGGGYASGREVVEFGAKFGALGLVSIGVITAGFGLLCALAFEFARVHRTYEYKGFMRALIGPLWPLFDLLYVVMAVLVIAIVTSATGTIAQSVLGVPSWLAVIAVIAVVGALIFGGHAWIARFATGGTALLYGAFLLFGALVIVPNISAVGRGLGADTTSFLPSATWGDAAASGALYVSYNLVVLPATLFVLGHQRERRESLVGGLLAGLLAIVPFALTYLSVMAFYPDEAVLAAEVPWLEMLSTVGGTGLAALYAIVVVFTLVDTAVALLHAILDRVSTNLTAVGRAGLSPTTGGVVSVAVLAGAVLLSQVGIVALVAQGYTYLAFGFMALFALPLLTVGVYKIVKGGGGDAPTAVSHVPAASERV